MDPTHISVILPAYNAAPFVAATVESILAQTLREFELLVIDDGSTDETPAMLADFARRDHRIRVITQANSGQSMARNLGMREARSEIVAFIDADDLATKRRLEWQVHFLAENPEVGLVGGAMEEIDELGCLNGFAYRPPLTDSEIRVALQSGSPLVMPSVAARKAALLAVGGFRPQFNPSDDYDLWLRLRGHIRFANLPDILVRYRVHGKSISHARILYYALTTPAARAAASLRESGKADPTEGCAALTEAVLAKLGFTPPQISRLQAAALLSYGSKMVSRSALAAAEDLLRQFAGLEMEPRLRRELEPEALILWLRIRVTRKERLAAMRLLLSGLISQPKLACHLAAKLWRLGLRATSRGR